jgi:O-antigen/teichoic acid export membrane protein
MAGLALVAIPILVGALGPEAYGLVGLGLAMESLLALLDFGLSVSVNREMARNVASDQPPQVNRDLLRTLEIVYWPIGLTILALMVGGAGWLAEHAVRPTTLSYDTVRFAFVMLGLGFAARWPISLYQGVLRGLQTQVLMNVIRIAGSVFRVLGGVAAVLLIAPTIRVFFIVQFLGSIFELVLITGAAWKTLTVGYRRPRSKAAFIRSIWRFALGFGALSILTQLLYWSGILAVARSLPLEEAGFYTVALSLASLVMFVPFAIYDAAFPRFAGQAQLKDTTGFKETFQNSLFVSTLWSVMIGMPIVFFTSDILYLWTRSESVAAGASLAASVLALGYLAYQFWFMYYAALTAAGMIRFPLVLTVCVVPIALVATVMSVGSKGAAGPAAVLSISNLVLAIGYVGYSLKAGWASETAAGAARAIGLLLSSAAIFFGVSALSGDSSTLVRLSAAIAASLGSLAVAWFWLRPQGLRLPWEPELSARRG